MRRGLTAAAALLASGVPALGADSLFDTVFAKADSGRPCYARAYDAMHLKAHPRQTVTRITVSFNPQDAESSGNSPEKFILRFAFQLKGSHDWHGAPAYCAAKGRYFSCYLDADGGEFNLTPQNGTLKLDVINRGGIDAAADQINVEDENFVGFGKPSGDDLSFAMSRAPRAACDASSQ